MAAIDARHLDGVSETALITLNQRATEANRPDGVLEDPMAIVLRDSLDYDYHHFGRTHQGIALRALTFDTVSNEYLAEHPRATVVALAEWLADQLLAYRQRRAELAVGRPGTHRAIAQAVTTPV